MNSSAKAGEFFDVDKANASCLHEMTLWSILSLWYKYATNYNRKGDVRYDYKYIKSSH